MPAEYGEPLSERELQIIDLVAEGLTNREIAGRLYVSPNTVKVHLRNIFTKTGVSSRTELTVTAMQAGWIEVPGVTPEEASSKEGEATAQEIPTGVALPQLPPWPVHRWIVLAAGLILAGIVLFLPQHPTGQAASTDPGEIFGPGQAAPGAPAPATEDGWKELPPIPVRRAGLGVAALKGVVYAVGGMTSEGPTGRLDIYKVETLTWQEGRPRPAALANINAVIVNGKMLVPAGCDAAWRPSNVTHLYDIENDTWTEVAPLPVSLCAYALATYQDRAYLFGGWDGASYQAVAYVYDAASDTWEKIPAPAEARGFGAAATLANRIFYVGGYDGKQELDTCEVFLAEEERWEPCPRLLQPRGGLGLAAVGEHVYAIGGGWVNYLGFNERYDPPTNEWSVMETPIIGEWRNLGLVSLETSLYVIGGWSGDYLNRTYAEEVLPWRVFIPTTFTAP